MKYLLIIYLSIALLVMYNTVNPRARLSLWDHFKQLATPFAWPIALFYSLVVYLIWIKNNW